MADLKCKKGKKNKFITYEILFILFEVFNSLLCITGTEPNRHLVINFSIKCL